MSSVVNVAKLRFTLDSLFGSGTQYELLESSPWYEYDANGAKGKQIGTSYTVGVVGKHMSITVKVSHIEPIVSTEDIKKSPVPILVIFGNNEVSFYGNSLYSANMKVVADSITKVTATETPARTAVKRA
jgi:hypothetical protein